MRRHGRPRLHDFLHRHLRRLHVSIDHALDHLSDRAIESLLLLQIVSLSASLLICQIGTRLEVILLRCQLTASSRRAARIKERLTERR